MCRSRSGSVAAAAANNSAIAADVVYESLEAQREAISGVNLDEEAIWYKVLVTEPWLEVTGGLGILEPGETWTPTGI